VAGICDALWMLHRSFPTSRSIPAQHVACMAPEANIGCRINAICSSFELPAVFVSLIGVSARNMCRRGVKLRT